MKNWLSYRAWKRGVGKAFGGKSSTFVGASLSVEFPFCRISHLRISYFRWYFILFCWQQQQRLREIWGKSGENLCRRWWWWCAFIIVALWLCI